MSKPYAVEAMSLDQRAGGPAPTSAGSTLSFAHLSYTVKTKDGHKKLIDDVSVHIKAGELLAIMGPSGAGKSTLLDLMSTRKSGEGTTLLNGSPLSPKQMLQISSFVEQEDALIGVLTVRETISYSLRLFLPNASRTFVARRVNRVVNLLGLASCSETRIGTPISRGISGGQKRRVSIACSLVAFPRVVFLDEPTSGLDSTSAREVMSAVRRVAREEGMICLATIHQPSLETSRQFTDLLLLTGGKTCYSGSFDGIEGFLEAYGTAVGRFVNPTDAVMDVLNTDFDGHFPTEGTTLASITSHDGSTHVLEPKREANAHTLREFYLSRASSGPDTPVDNGTRKTVADVTDDYASQEGKAGKMASLMDNLLVLSERTTKNYSRNLLAYGIRAGMYVGMGLMIAVIWIRLGQDASRINDRLSVHFYAIAFLAFMSVAGIPGFLEERAVFRRERANGLYGPLPFLLSNTIVSIPFLFACSLVFVLIMYWAVGLHPGGRAAFRYIGILFIALYAAESQVILVASLLPVFIAALAIAAFWNGFWMSVGGYFLRARNLPRFWYYSFHFMDFQKYAFELLVVSDLDGLKFTCNPGEGGCLYPSSIRNDALLGEDVLEYLGYAGTSYGKWIGILISIIVIYRIAIYLALRHLSKKW